MNEQQALKLVKQIKQEVPQIETSIVETRSTSGFYNVHCYLAKADRSLTIHDVEDWPSVKQVWQWFIPELEVEPEAKSKYLIRGIPMNVYQRKNGVWYGGCSIKGSQIRQYLGKEDPRTRFQEVPA